MNGNEFMTIIVRDDLEPGYKVVQSAHALADFAVKFDHEFKQWQLGSNYLCCLEASKDKIDKILYKLKDLNIKYEVFKEPDIGSQMTAVAIEAISREQHKKLFKNLQLTLN
jgi:hypothetical protein